MNKPLSLKIDLKDLKRLPREAWVLVAMVSGLLLWLGLFSWQVNRVLAQQGSLSTLQAERQRLEAVVVNNRKLEQRLRNLSEEWELRRVRLPRGEDYAGLVRLLGTRSQAKGVVLGPLSPVVASGQGVFPYITTPVEMSGSFPRVISLMNSLQTAGRAVILEDVTIALTDGGNVRAKMVLKAYFDSEAAPKAARAQDP